MALSRQSIKTALIAATVAAVVAATPALAAVIADYSKNSDKVDGKHAVSWNVGSVKRAGKLVATNSAGKLPDSIISKAPDANKLDGIDSTRLPVAAYHYRDDNGAVLPENGVMGMDSTDKRVLTLPTGSYSVVATASLDNNATTDATVECNLSVGSIDSVAINDHSLNLVPAGSNSSIVLAGVGTVNSFDKVALNCNRSIGSSPSGNWWRYIDITATKVTPIKVTAD